MVVHVVKADDIDSLAGQPGGKLVGILMAGKGAAKSEVHAQKPNAFAAAVHKMAVLNAHEAGFASGAVVKPGDV